MINSNYAQAFLTESRLYKYYLSDPANTFFQSEPPLQSFINRSFIQSSKELNLTGKVTSTDFDPHQHSSFQFVPEKPCAIKLSPLCDVSSLLGSACIESKLASAISQNKSEKPKHESAFHEFPQIKSMSFLALSSPDACFPGQIVEKKSISTKEEDSVPKIKTMILTPHKTINDFSNVYSKTAMMQGNAGGVPQVKVTPLIPSAVANHLLNSAKLMNETLSSCFLSRKKEREEHSITPYNKTLKAFNASSSSFKAKKKKKSKKSTVSFEKGLIEQDKDHRYNYLYKSFEEKYDPDWHYDNESSFMSYQFYLTFGRSNEEKMRFGENPLIHYQNLIENIKAKDTSSSHIHKLKQQAIQIQTVIANLPVLKSNERMPHAKGAIRDKEEAKPTKSSSAFEPDMCEMRYRCLVCGNCFSTAQGLGGHMSRKHKDQSENYRKKRHTREMRAPLRLLNEKVKQSLCEKYNKDYESMIATKEGKKELKRLKDKHHQEFLSMKRAMRKTL